MARGVNRHLTFAWIECQHSGDGAVFHAAFSQGRLGGRNLMLDIPRKGSKRVADGHPELPIVWRSFKTGKSSARTARGLLIMPTEMPDADFLARWAINPGLKKLSKTSSKLTFDNGGDDYCDILSVSGHGSGGAVWGDGSGSWVNIDLSKSFTKNAAEPSKGRLKYLLVPACYNLTQSNAVEWLTAHQKAEPIHGVLGYSGSYSGGATGARVMIKFAWELKKSVRSGSSILDAWKIANESYKQPWGATFLEAAVKDSMKQWITKAGLTVPAGATKVLHFDPGSYASGGTEVTSRPPDFQAIFVMDGGTAIDPSNNAQGNGASGLFVGKDGALLLKANHGNAFSSGDVVKIVFFLYRPRHDDMDLEKLLAFDTSSNTGSLVKLNDENKEDGTTHVDAIQYTFGTGETNNVKLPYKVQPDAHKNPKYPPISIGSNIHGRFHMHLVPPSFTTAIDMYTHGAWLRAP